MSPCLLVRLPRYRTFAVLLAVSFCAPLRADDDAKYDLHELALWGLDPTLQQANELGHYPSAMPGVVETERSRANEARKLTPLSIITLHGEPVSDLEIDLRVQSGRFLGHWPPAESKSGRLRWLDLASAAEAGPDALFAAVDEKHWFNQGRQLEALYVKDKSRAERFLTYDCELKYELPLHVTGGPEKYLITNSGKHPLLDLFVIVPQDDGVRIGRLDSLPTSKPKEAAKQPVADKPAEAKPQSGKAVDTPAATPKNDAPAAEPPPAEKKEATEQKAETAKQAAAAVLAGGAAPAAVAAPAVAAPAGAAPGGAAPAAAAAPGGAAPAQATPPAASLEPTELAMSNVVARDSDEFKAIGQTFAASLGKLGFTPQEIDLLVARAGATWLENKDMVVLFRLPAEAIEERLPLTAYPAPCKTLRAALVVVRNLDPQIKDEVQKLIAQLGSPEYAAREQAEKRLGELGRLAVPELKTALKSTDLEIVFRAERVLLAQNEKLEGT
ncbi:MAG TPA: hypothetical protein VFI31_24955 [Pirellulales bacterium]|nr:hypothetical protein [Pirellulales bacterium]